MDRLFDWIRPSPRHLFALSLAGGLLLFLPVGALNQLGLEDFVESYRSWIGGVFLASSVLLCAHLLGESGAFLVRRASSALSRRQGVRRLQRLTADERRLLAGYLTDSSRVRELDADGLVARRLIADDILYRPPGTGAVHDTGPGYQLQPWVREHVTRNPGLLAGDDRPQA